MTTDPRTDPTDPRSYPPPAAPPTAPPKRNRWTTPGVALVSLFVGVGIGVIGTSSQADTDKAAADATYSADYSDALAGADALNSAPAADPALTEDGTYLVGTDIQPGSYRATDAPTNCYWELDTTTGEIINNGYEASPIINIPAEAYSFKSQNCGTWEKIG